MPDGRRAVGTVILLACLCPGLAAAASPAAPRPSAGCRAATVDSGRPLERSIDVGGVRRTYILDVPETVQAGVPVPLLFDFHGFEHSGVGVWRVSRFKDFAAVERFVTVYPDGLPVTLLGREGRGWQIRTVDGNRDLAFVAALLDDLEGRYCIDRGRVYATGFSNGAFLSNLLACTWPDRFAAVAPVGGGALTTPCTPARAVPVLIHHGRNDQLIPPEHARAARDAWRTIDGCGAPVTDGCEWARGCRDGAEVGYCEDDGGHHWPEAATARIWEFFRRHPLPAPATP